MAISWGAYEPSSLPQLRVGIEVTWSSVTYSSTSVTATVKYYTGANGDWWDDQHMTLTGAITGGFDFSNHQVDGTSVLRATRTKTYTYPSGSYGTSPGQWTFGASVSGCFNGATPSKSLTVSIPARPSPPLQVVAPSNVTSVRVTDYSIKTTWTNRSADGAAWSLVRVQIDGPGPNDIWNGDVGTTSGTATSFTDSTNPEPNSSYRYRVRSESGSDVSVWVEGPIVYTTPATPTNVSAYLNGDSISVSWQDNVGYSAHSIEVWRYVDGSGSLAATLSAGSTSWTDYYLTPGSTYRYAVRTKTTAGPLIYSAMSAQTYAITIQSEEPPPNEPPPVEYSTPNPPDYLSPDDNVSLSAEASITFSWRHNSTDGTGQTSYEVQWRQSGGTFHTTGRVYSSSQSRTYPADTFPTDATIEWQVRTWGVLADPSDWSDLATFTTQGPSEFPPFAPTLLEPINGAVVDRATVISLRWVFAGSMPGDTQTGYAVRYRKVGTTAWTETGWVTSTQSWHDLIANSLVAGDYEWQAATKGSTGLAGPYAPSQFFSAISKPAAPTILSPTAGAEIESASVLVSWAATSQDSYQLTATMNGEVVVDTGTISDDEARSGILLFPENRVQYVISLRVGYHELWSDWSTVTVLVDYEPPPAPRVALEVMLADAAIKVTPSYAVPVPIEPDIVGYDVWVRKAGDVGNGMRIAENVPATSPWIWWLPQPRVDYQLRAQSVGENGARAWSGWAGKALDSRYDTAEFDEAYYAEPGATFDTSNYDSAYYEG